MLRWVGHLQVWSMLEVVMLGILVALVKIAELATVDPGIGMYAFGAVILLMPAIAVNVDRRELWRRIEWMGGTAMKGPALTAVSRRSRVLRVLSLVSRPARADEPGFCRRCGEKLEIRRHGSIETTWALLISAAICYIPANVLPVLEHDHTLGLRGRHHFGRRRHFSTPRDPGRWRSWC